MAWVSNSEFSRWFHFQSLENRISEFSALAIWMSWVFFKVVVFWGVPIFVDSQTTEKAMLQKNPPLFGFLSGKCLFGSYYMFICHSFSMRWSGPRFLNATFFCPKKMEKSCSKSRAAERLQKPGKSLTTPAVFDNSVKAFRCFYWFSNSTHLLLSGIACKH